MARLEREGIPTHLIRELNERETRVKRVSIIPLEVILRSVAASSFSKRYGVEEGLVFPTPMLEFSYKNDALGNPLASREELSLIRSYTLTVNRVFQDIWKSCGITLVDFKVEFGRWKDGSVVLADEISPDTCRLWDTETREKLDKDRFHRDLGGVEEAYIKVMDRLTRSL